MRVTVGRLGHLGDGIAEGPVYVPRTLPGEVVEGDVTGGRMSTPKIVTPSVHRIRPACPHYRSCGGCALQHASDNFVRDWKIEVVRTALAAHGLTASIAGVTTSPPSSRRRATLHGRRLKKGVLVGFHGRASDALIGIPNCGLLHPDLMAGMPAYQALTSHAASRRGDVSIAATATDSGLDVSLTDARPLDRDGLATAVEICQVHDLARLTWNGETVAERRPPIVRFGAASVVLPPGAFLQATAEGEAALLSAVAEAVESARRVADLFSGCGTFALPLAEKAEIHAVEFDSDMLAALDRGWRHAPGLQRVTTEVRDLFRRPLQPDELGVYDAVLLDPPRAGAEAQATCIAASVVGRVAAVSCNPVTFSRDARHLVDGGFRLDWVRVVDQFRWSPHVELVASFSRGDGQPRY